MKLIWTQFNPLIPELDKNNTQSTLAFSKYPRQFELINIFNELICLNPMQTYN
jgi:hypothetical protein